MLTLYICVPRQPVSEEIIQHLYESAQEHEKHSSEHDVVVNELPS